MQVLLSVSVVTALYVNIASCKNEMKRNLDTSLWSGTRLKMQNMLRCSKDLKNK